jgi:hypothetical protein
MLFFTSVQQQIVAHFVAPKKPLNISIWIENNETRVYRIPELSDRQSFLNILAASIDQRITPATVQDLPLPVFPRIAKCLPTNDQDQLIPQHYLPMD